MDEGQNLTLKIDGPFLESPMMIQDFDPKYTGNIIGCLRGSERRSINGDDEEDSLVNKSTMRVARVIMGVIEPPRLSSLPPCKARFLTMRSTPRRCHSWLSIDEETAALVKCSRRSFDTAIETHSKGKYLVHGRSRSRHCRHAQQTHVSPGVKIRNWPELNPLLS